MESKDDKNDLIYRIQVIRPTIPGKFWLNDTTILTDDVAKSWSCSSERFAMGMAAEYSKRFPEWRFLITEFSRTVTVSTKATIGFSGGKEIGKVG